MSASEDSDKRVRLEPICTSMSVHGYARFSASVYRELVGREALNDLSSVQASFADLVADDHMGDGGTYRRRAYSRWLVKLAGDGKWVFSSVPGHSIYQTIEDNPVNGGVLRTFKPLADKVAGGPLLQALLRCDAEYALACDRELFQEDVVVGVHQVRILARAGIEGHPAPEGIHRDRERFTFQHFLGRHNIEGGEFRAHDEEKVIRMAWLQKDPLDSVMFQGSTWHSATPITCANPQIGEGHRDIFLIDFDRFSS